MLRKYLDLIVVTVVLTFGAAVLTYVDASGDRKPIQKHDQTLRGNEPAKDAAGMTEEPQNTRENAVQKEGQLPRFYVDIFPTSMSAPA